MALTFYTNPMSRGRIARWMLEETGEPYDTVLVDWTDKPTALLAANPLGKVPTIEHDGHVVSEAAAICAYCAEVPAAKRGMVGYGSFAEAVNTLEHAVSRAPYVAGDRFTAADVYVGSAVGWFTQFGMLDKRPAFTDYLARLWNRPAWVRAREIDDALMPAA